MLKIQIILGSTRQNRFSEKPGRWIIQELQKRKDVAGELLDLRDYPMPFFDEKTYPSDPAMEYSHEVAATWAKKVAEADGYIIVTPEYNHGYPSVLKNALDYAYHEWNDKPVAFFSYGGAAGGARAVEQLRQVALGLQMIPLYNTVHVVWYKKFLDANGDLQTETFQANTDAMIDQLLLWARALQQVREDKKK